MDSSGTTSAVAIIALFDVIRDHGMPVAEHENLCFPEHNTSLALEYGRQITGTRKKLAQNYLGQGVTATQLDGPKGLTLGDLPTATLFEITICFTFHCN